MAKDLLLGKLILEMNDCQCGGDTPSPEPPALVIYEPSVDDAATTEYAVGGIVKGTKAEDLRGKTMSEVFDLMMFPVVLPTFTEPSASINLSPNTTILEVFSNKSSLPTPSVSFNRGSINVNGKSVGYRAGEVVRGSESFKYNNKELSQLDTYLPAGAITITGTVRYAQGDQPVDSRGNSVGSPLPAGSISASKTVNVVYPVYAGTGTLSKLSLTTSKTISDIALTNESTSARQSFSVKGTMTKIELLDTLSNTYREIPLSTFTSRKEKRSFSGGNEVEYTTYIRNTESLNGGGKFRITFN